MRSQSGDTCPCHVHGVHCSDAPASKTSAASQGGVSKPVRKRTSRLYGLLRMERLVAAVSVVLAAAGAVPGGDIYSIPVTGDLTPAVVRQATKWMKSLVENKVVPGTRQCSEWMKHRHSARHARTWFSTLFTTFQVSSSKPSATERQPYIYIPDHVLEECVRTVITNHYRTRWQAGHRDLYLQQVMEDYKCSIFYLWRKMQEYEPRLRWCLRLTPRMELTNAHKTARFNYAERFKRLGPNRLMRVIWIDKRKLHIAPKHAIKHPHHSSLPHAAQHSGPCHWLQGCV